MLDTKILETIERIILNHGIAEVKIEGKRGVVVVEIDRTVKYPSKEKHNE